MIDYSIIKYLPADLLHANYGRISNVFFETNIGTIVILK